MKIKLKYGIESEFLTITKFPSGEPCVKWKPDVLFKAVLDEKYRSRIDFSKFEIQMDRFDYPLLACAVDALRKVNGEATNIELFLPYFAGSRQDRVCNIGEALSVKVYADMINALKFNRVTIMDPHSDVTPALIDNVNVIPHGQYSNNNTWSIIDRFFEDQNRPEKIFVIAPDVGASKKVQNLIRSFNENWENPLPKPEIVFGQGLKYRDTKTNELSGFGVDNEDFENCPILVTDDLNCKAGTFLGLGEILKEKNAGVIALYTTHVDCYEGIQNVINSAYYEHYYTTNSEYDWESSLEFQERNKKNINRLTIFDVF